MKDIYSDPEHELWHQLQIVALIVHDRPIYIGKNLGFLLYRLHCQKNP